MTDFSFIANAHPSYIENLYDQYQTDPQGVEQSWAAFFKGFEYAGSANGNGAAITTEADADVDHMAKELKLLALIKGYRDRGHLLSKTNPIRERRNRRPAVNIEDYGLSEADWDTVFYSGREIGLKDATLRQIIERLQTVYTGTIGFEYHHIANRTKRRWIRKRIEELQPDQAYGIPIEKKKRILDKLNGSTIFENFLHTKYVGQKRFSLEGGESAIVALDAIINEAAQQEAEEIVIGMAHRGRLNVLANIMGKTYAQIFNEFEGNQPISGDGDGDVKYHLGYSSQVEATNGKTVYLKLAPNPSHLEAVGPVVTGFTRAKADNMYDNNYDTILPIIIHGDAALAGQGVVFETVQMSHLEAYETGGTIHIVINNQVGFTTDFTEARTSTYSTGVARIADAPVFHVNGDDPEAVLYCCELALRYRQEFNADVFIDIVGYRRHGHNEGDDPEFTQPEMYKNIKNHPNTRELYVQTLVKRGDLDKQLADEMEENFRSLLQERLDEVRENKLEYEYQEVEQVWRKLKRTTEPEDFKVSPVTATTEDKVELILDKLVELPEGFKPIRKVKRLFKNIEKARAENAYDWGMGELLAYGTLLMEGHNVRMSGQDVRRGTFSHRHAVLSDAETYGKIHNRLANLSDDQADFRIFNSHLSEYAVLGFEYGYAMASPNDLVLWEAQFGDFSNGAQIIYDQFISAAESKWRRMNGLVCLLPHGYAGQGPEHSSARLERYLQLCAEFNMTVANVTLPANFFHLLRRQLERPFRKPLIVMSPKSLLRHSECVSPKEDFVGDTRFQELLDDPTVGPRSNAKVKRLLLCSGKIYFDLAAYKRENKRDDVAIVRLEQLYPLPVEQLNYIFKRYNKTTDILWVQEEPSNMGAWQYIHSMRLNKEVHLPRELDYVSRKSSASPATGFKWVHDVEQKDLVERAFK